MHNIALVINTLNEEKHIAACINSAKSLADEIIICDMYSDDETVEIAKALGAKVYFHERTGFVEPARFYAISKASCEWILILDADERLTSELSNKLKLIVEEDSADLVLIASLFNYFGKYIKHGGFFNNNWPRFFKRESYIEVYSNDENLVHHNFANLRQFTDRQIQLSKAFFIIHEAYPTIEKYISKTLSTYAILESNQRFQKGEQVPFLKVCLVPLKEFFKRYVFLRGFRDGKIGLILCYLKSQHTFYILLNIWFKNKVRND